MIRIPVQTRPFFLDKDYGKLKRHVVYIRRGSSTGEADPEEIRNMGRSEVRETQEIPVLSFEFANLANRSSCGTKIDIEATLLNIPPIKEIPDYYENTGPFGIGLSHARPDYYRDLVTYYYFLKKSSELEFLLKNESSQAISDVRVELVVEKQESKFTFLESSRFPDFPESHFDMLKNIRPIAEQIAETNRRRIKLQDLGNCFRIEVPFEKVQPKQTVFSTKTIFLVSNESFSSAVRVTIYADNIPVPIEQELELVCNVMEEDGSFEHIREIHKEYLRTKHSS